MKQSQSMGPVDAQEAARAQEREQVEWVFRLTGGELETEPWEPWQQTESDVDGKPLYDAIRTPTVHLDGMRQTIERYWYEGAPDYDEEHGDRSGGTFRTVVWPGGTINAPQREYYDSQGVWILVATFGSSGEVDCPLRDWDPDTRTDAVSTRAVSAAEAQRGDGECYLCGEQEGEEHGYIYLGSCGYEAVYELQETWQEDEDELPPCVRAMRCYCAGHARGNPASEPCDTREHA